MRTFYSYTHPLVIARSAGLFSNPSATATDWPVFRGDVTNTGVTVAVDAVELEDEPRVLWQLNTGDIVESSLSVFEVVRMLPHLPGPATLSNSYAII